MPKGATRGSNVQRYLERYAEPGLPDCPVTETTLPRWYQVLVIPAYREEVDILKRLQDLPVAQRKTLVILVLNRPDSDEDANANTALRDAVAALPTGGTRAKSMLHQLNASAELYCFDTEHHRGPLPKAEGVGYARKLGCDLALQWLHAGAIQCRWITSTDADATLPAACFERLEQVPLSASAATFPFYHVPGDDLTCHHATQLYELRLHQYVAGLRYADSPYAHYTLGSCLAIDVEAYIKVRGFPKRAGGEDFYLLNKLAKVGTVDLLRGPCVAIQSRPSNRVPFGTGPAVQDLLQKTSLHNAPLFYHPACFAALHAVLQAVPQLKSIDTSKALPGSLLQGLHATLAEQTVQILEGMGLAQGLEHCQSHSRSLQQFQRHFHQWFDGWRTLKLIHGLRDNGWPMCSLRDLQVLSAEEWPQLLPTVECLSNRAVDTLLNTIRVNQEWEVM